MRYLRYCSAIAFIGTAACNQQQPQGTEGFTVFATAKVVGTVTNAAGDRLDSVRVFVEIPESVRINYGSAYAISDRNGNYSFQVERMAPSSVTGGPDTLRVKFYTNSIKRGATPTEQSPVISSQVLEFGEGSDGPTKRIDLSLQSNP